MLTEKKLFQIPQLRGIYYPLALLVDRDNHNQESATHEGVEPEKRAMFIDSLALLVQKSPEGGEVLHQVLSLFDEHDLLRMGIQKKEELQIDLLKHRSVSDHVRSQLDKKVEKLLMLVEEGMTEIFTSSDYANMAMEAIQSDEGIWQKIREAIQARYLNTPKGDLLIARNKQGEIVGMEGISVFQMTPSLLQYVPSPPEQAEKESPHGFSSLAVRSDMRHQGLGSALKELAMDYGVRTFGFSYIHTDPKVNLVAWNRSFGFESWKEGVDFFSEEESEEVMRHYNIHGKVLLWKKIVLPSNS